MKILFENWRKFLIKENYSVEREDGYVIYRLPQGYIKIIENSPYAGGAHSIYGFYVDEEHRNKGIGKQLVKIVVDAYPDKEISAQVSSLSSLKAFLDLGFRAAQEPNADFERAKELFDENYGSLNVRLNDPKIESNLNEAPKRKSAAGIKKAIKDLTQQGGNTGGNPTGMKAVKRPLGDKDKDEISAPPGAPGGGSIGAGALEEAFEKEEMSMYPWLEKIAGKSWSEAGEILESEFEYIGRGSFREVYSPIGDDDVVIKYIYNDLADIYMNKKETEISSVYPRLFPKTFVHSPDFSWIAMEKIEPVDDADEIAFKKVVENFPKLLNYMQNEMPYSVKEIFTDDLESYEGIWNYIIQSLMYGGAYKQSKYKNKFSSMLSDRYQKYDIIEKPYRVFYRKLFEYGMKNESLYFLIYKAYNELQLDIMDWVGPGNIGLNADDELKIIDASYFDD